MPYDPQYNKSSWSSEQLVTSTKLNQMVDNTDHNYKYKPELGPDASTSIPTKIARGTKRFNFGASDGSQTATITFATDSDDGDPGFSNAPRIICNLSDLENEPSLLALAEICAFGKTNTLFKIFISRGSGTGEYWYDVDWLAIGI